MRLIGNSMRLIRNSTPLLFWLPIGSWLLIGSASAERLPDALAAPGETALLTLHAQGEQIYECKAGSDGKLVWIFHEPAATLTAAGKIAGHHTAGPTWQLNDGSSVVGKTQASVPGRTAKDVAWLKLNVVSHQGSGALTDVDTVQRINTVGGVLEGSCERAGDTQAMPYTADYIFLRKG